MTKKQKMLMVSLIILTVFNVLVLITNLLIFFKYNNVENIKVNLEHTDFFDLSEQEIQLNGGENFSKIAVTLVLNTDSQTYKDLNGDFSTYSSVLQSIVLDNFLTLTKEEALNNKGDIALNIKRTINDKFGKNFCFEVLFTSYIVR